MDRIKKYQNILISYMEDYAKVKPVNLPEVEQQVIADRKNNHFQFLRVGWQKDQFVFGVIFHFDIKDGKVWVQRNNTEREVEDELVEMGVRQQDIVFGFQPPMVREFLEKTAA